MGILCQSPDPERERGSLQESVMSGKYEPIGMKRCGGYTGTPRPSTLMIQNRRLKARIQELEAIIAADRCVVAGCANPSLRGAFCEEHNAKVPTDEPDEQLCACGKPLDRLWSCHYCGIVPGPSLKSEGGQ